MTPSSRCDCNNKLSPSQDVIEPRVQLDVVLVDVVVEVFSSQNLGYSHQLREKQTGCHLTCETFNNAGMDEALLLSTC